MRFLALLAALLFGIPSAYAQSTASQVVTGYLTNTGCPSPTSPQAYCFVQYGAGGGGVASNVNVTGLNGVAPLVGAGATGTGSLRDTVAQDTTTIAGSAPGIAGTPSANVLSVQGVAGGTALPTSSAPSSSASVGITAVVSASAEASHVLKASAGNLYDVYVTTGATAGYLLVFNATSAPSNGAVTPIDCTIAPAGSTTSIYSAGAPPEVFSTGIVVAFSTTGCFTLTTSATAFFHGRIQ